ncbi:MAG: hypothetical protein V5A76_06075 [Candidatus Thermoplasmatota archaeon]
MIVLLSVAVVALGSEMGDREEQNDKATITRVDEGLLQGAYFDVTIDSTNLPRKEGEALNVDATISNTGDEPILKR